MSSTKRWLGRLGRRSPGLILRGVCMGAADVIPGVSGGTIALITGIYDELISTIAGIDMEVLKLAGHRHPVQALERANAAFMLPLLIGIVLAIASMARPITYLLSNHPEPVWAFFTGLIVASALFVGRQVERWAVLRVASLLAGVAVGLIITSLVPVQTGPTLPKFFLAGMVAIVAMVLPGISGSFLLVLMGKYRQVLAAVHERHAGVLAAFCAGGVLGVLLFSRLLKALLARFHAGTMAFLVGLMLGALRKVWPFRQVLEERQIGDKVIVLRDRCVWPTQMSSEVVFSLGLMAAGAILVLVLERLGGRLKRHSSPDADDVRG